MLGTILILRQKANIESSLGAVGVPEARADRIADALSHSGGGSGFSERAGPRAQELFATVQGDFASAMQVVVYAMAGLMLAAFAVAVVGMPAGRVEEADEPAGAPSEPGEATAP